MNYKDAQTEAKTYYPDNFDKAEAAIVVQCWKEKPKNEELWFVFVTCLQSGGTALLRFAYPFGGARGTADIERKVIANAQQQHEFFKRPPIIGPAEVVQVTQELIDQLKGKSTTTPVQASCDFCCASTENPTKIYEATDFVMQNGQTSVGGWAACDKCAAMIDSHDTDALARRIVKVCWGLETKQALQAACRQVSDFLAHRL